MCLSLSVCLYDANFSPRNFNSSSDASRMLSEGPETLQAATSSAPSLSGASFPNMVSMARLLARRLSASSGRLANGSIFSFAPMRHFRFCKSIFHDPAFPIWFPVLTKFVNRNGILACFLGCLPLLSVSSPPSLSPLSLSSTLPLRPRPLPRALPLPFPFGGSGCDFGGSSSTHPHGHSEGRSSWAQAHAARVF